MSEPLGENVEVEQSNDGINEAWNPLLEKLPAAYHEHVTPVLKEWDKGVQSRFDSLNQKYNPYNEFVDQKIDPAVLRVGLSIVQQVQTNPRALYEDLGKHLGITAEQAQQVVEEELGDEEYVDPRLDQVLQQQQQMQQYIQQQQQAETERRVDAEVKRDVDALVEKYNIPRGPVLGSIIQRALAAGDFDLEAAYQKEMQYQQFLAQNHPNNNAPHVASGSGSVGGQPQKSIADLPAAERRAALTQLMRNANQN